MSFFPIASLITEAYNRIENNFVQDLIIPIASAFFLVGGCVDILTSPIRYTDHKKSQKKLLQLLFKKPFNSKSCVSKRGIDFTK